MKESISKVAYVTCLVREQVKKVAYVTCLDIEHVKKAAYVTPKKKTSREFAFVFLKKIDRGKNDREHFS